MSWPGHTTQVTGKQHPPGDHQGPALIVERGIFHNRGHIEEYCIKSKVFIRVRNGQGWIQLKLKEEYMTLQGRLHDYSLLYNSKVKCHFEFI